MEKKPSMGLEQAPVETEANKFLVWKHLTKAHVEEIRGASSMPERIDVLGVCLKVLVILFFKA